MGARITFLIVCFSVFYAFLIFNIYNLQVTKSEFYQAQAESINRLAGFLTPYRGEIYFTDKDGSRIPAAINKEYPAIFIVPEEVENPAEAAEFLASISGRDEVELLNILNKSDDPYEPIVKRATEAQIELVNQADIKGIKIGSDHSRFYPLGAVAAHLLGFTSVDVENPGGRYGLEAYQEEQLGGEAGFTNGDRLSRAEPGQDLYLTIDRNIQVQAENTLEKLITDYGAQGGTVMVADPRTGKILAMSSYPDFDPNNYGQFPVANFLNPAVQAVYEPGSIFKVITMASALDAGKITPNTTFYDSGSLTLNGKTIKNWDLKAHGTVTMTNVIEKSINTGAAFAERALGNQNFYNYLVKFGLKEKTEIDLPSEIIGSLLPLEEDQREINFATASFGQGISMTPIQLLTAISAIANHGVMMKPYVDAREEPEEIGRVVSEDASRKVVGMMVSAVNKAEIARIPGYNVAGKTGTAQVPNFATGGYTDEVINTYVGFAPAYDPEFIIMIKMNKPAGAPLAGLTVVPAFRELAEFVINYYNIPPDNIGQ
ncbi:MAG: penicillin-binding protein 2 [Candidatus Colwellbacteria bacterium]|nr:penicillin-binding protein 2 [Candidatus Colwellbacteria bacterium]